MKKRTRNYRMNLPDGIEHRLIIRDEEDDVYTVESVHSFSGHTVVTERYYNKCIFEELLGLGIITPVV
jgi:hypothetical protein